MSSQSRQAPNTSKEDHSGELQQQYNAYKGQLTSLAQKIGELEGDLDEHRWASHTEKEYKSNLQACH